MAGRYSRKYQNDEEFDEGEVWGTNNNNYNSNNYNNNSKDSTFFTTSSTSPRNFTVVNSPRMIPRASSTEVVTNDDNSKQSSLPLDIPDWSKIYGKTVSQKKRNNDTSNNNNVVNGHSHGHDNFYGNNGYNGNCSHGDGSDDDDDINGMIPPHEYLARKLARNQISSFSVYEGIGRTLKGRDLSKVRNTILSKTGFLE